MIAGAIALVCGSRRSFADQANADGMPGPWYLLSASGDEVRVPQHRMDLRFWSESGELKGAIVSRRNGGTEMPLAKSAFDGSTLQLAMQAPSGKSQAEMPTLVMTRNGNKFEGYWTDTSGTKIGPPLKLVRARK